MKFKKLTSVFAAAVMAFSMAVTAYADHNLGSVDPEEARAMQAYLGEEEATVYEARKTLDQLKAEYPDGSYYSKTGKACSCHDHGYNPCDWNSGCDCINFDASLQCVAFAKYVFYNLRGYKWINGSTTWLNITNSTADKAKNALLGVPAGTYVLVKRGPGYDEHSLSIVGTTSNKVTVYDANSDYCPANGKDYNKCMVRYWTMSWDEFAAQYQYIYKYVV